MSLAEGCLGMAFVGLVLYVVFGGADFGGGLWELIAWVRGRGRNAERLVEETLAPVWEANHVWLIFVIVVAWTAFPRAVARAAAELLVPLSAVAVGIIVRGTAFVFLKADATRRGRPLYVLLFGLASLVTPFFLGAAGGALAAGRIGAAGTDVDLLRWLAPTPLFAGALTVAISAYLAAVFLTVEATRRGAADRAEAYRSRALGMALVAGAIALGGLVVVRSDAPRLWEGLTSRGAPFVAASLISGALTIALLWVRRYAAARVSAVGAVAALLAGWAAGQYPWILAGTLLIEDAAAPAATLRVLLWSLGVGALLFAPPLVALLWLSQRGELTDRSRERH